MLLTTLEICNTLTYQNATSCDLKDRYSLSQRTLLRHIKEARHLGAKIESEKIDGVYYWTLHNADAIQPNLQTWRALEKGRSLTDQPRLF